MQIVCLGYAPDKKEEPGAGVLYQIAQRVFDTLPPLSTITQYHRDPVPYNEWRTQHREVMEQGYNRGKSSIYDYDFFPLAPSDFFKIHLHVTGCPLYGHWEPANRPHDWQVQMEQEEAYCSYVSIQTEGWSAPETVRYGRQPLTDAKMTVILEHALDAGLPVRVHGSPDDISLSSSLSIRTDQLKKQILPNGMTHWLCTIEEPNLVEV